MSNNNIIDDEFELITENEEAEMIREEIPRLGTWAEMIQEEIPSNKSYPSNKDHIISSSEIKKYDDIFEELYNKYGGVDSESPEMTFMKLMAGNAIRYHYKI